MNRVKRDLYLLRRLEVVDHVARFNLCFAGLFAASRSVAFRIQNPHGDGSVHPELAVTASGNPRAHPGGNPQACLNTCFESEACVGCL